MIQPAVHSIPPQEFSRRHENGGSTDRKAFEMGHLVYHAASHAVICFLLYGEEVIRDLRLETNQGEMHPGLSTFSRLPIPICCRPSGGAPRRGNPAPVTSDAIVDAYGILTYAGLAGETILSAIGREESGPEESFSRYQCLRAAADRKDLASLASLLGLPRAAEHFYEGYWNEATRLLQSHWSGVSRLAEELARKGFLHGSRVDTLLCESFPV